MPLYNTATVATALHVPAKWLDNLLSHNKIDGVSGGRQGVRRRLSADAVRVVAVVKDLTDGWGLPVPAAVRIASLTVASDPVRRVAQPKRVPLSSFLTIEIDLAALDREIHAGLAHAVEVTPHPARGRPRRAAG